MYRISTYVNMTLTNVLWMCRVVYEETSVHLRRQEIYLLSLLSVNNVHFSTSSLYTFHLTHDEK